MSIWSINQKHSCKNTDHTKDGKETKGFNCPTHKLNGIRELTYIIKFFIAYSLYFKFTYRKN